MHEGLFFIRGQTFPRPGHFLPHGCSCRNLCYHTVYGGGGNVAFPAWFNTFSIIMRFVPAAKKNSSGNRTV